LVSDPATFIGNLIAVTHERNTHLIDHDLERLFRLSPDESTDWIDRVRRAEAPSKSDNLGKLGRYELRSILGQGGQGCVYRARQPATNRDVAIKRLATGSFATREMRARFRREIDLTARLRHPNIVTVYGTERINGSDVLVMELIDGGPIDAWASEHLHAGGSVNRIVEVFTRVCHAVAYAHQLGVLHRDLKPSNILVDSNGEPHVVDFGVARLIPGPDGGATAITNLSAGFAGTPLYTAPEQMDEPPPPADMRADVYSLGVVLYALLSGRTPHRSARTLAELRDSIRSATPDRPSGARRDIPPDLDAIVLKAIAAEPARRYPTMDAFIDDLTRYLRGEIVSAVAPGMLYRARKTMRRHRGMLTICAIVLSSLLIGLIGTTLALRQARAAQEAAETSERSAEQVIEFLTSMLTGPDASERRAYNIPLSVVLDRASEHLLSGSVAHQPETETRLWRTIAETYRTLGLFPDSAHAYDRAITAARGSDRADDASFGKLLLAAASMAQTMEDFTYAHALIDEAEAVLRRRHDADCTDLIQVQHQRAMNLYASGEETEGRELLCALATEAVACTGNDTDPIVIAIRSDLGFVAGCNTSWEDGLVILTDVLRIQHDQLGPDHVGVSRTLLNIGSLHQNLRRYEEAEPYFLNALAIREQYFGRDHSAVASVLYNVATTFDRTGRRSEAVATLREALDIQERLLVPGHYDTARTRMRLGNLLVHTGALEEAEALLRHAIRDFEPRRGHRADRINWTRRYLAHCLIRQRRFEEAEEILITAMIDAELRFADGPEPAAVQAALDRLHAAWNRDRN